MWSAPTRVIKLYPSYGQNLCNVAQRGEIVERSSCSPLATSNASFFCVGTLLQWKMSATAPSLKQDSRSTSINSMTTAGLQHPWLRSYRTNTGCLRAVFAQVIVFSVDADSGLNSQLMEEIRRKNIRFSCHVRDSRSFRGSTTTIGTEFSPH